MKKLLALILPAAFTILSCSASAGVAPIAPNSALAQSGAKVAPSDQLTTEDKDDKRERQENIPKACAN